MILHINQIVNLCQHEIDLLDECAVTRSLNDGCLYAYILAVYAEIGGPDQNRTDDLRNAIAPLFQLSYEPVKWMPHPDLHGNLTPSESVGLLLSHGAKSIGGALNH